MKSPKTGFRIERILDFLEDRFESPNNLRFLLSELKRAKCPLSFVDVSRIMKLKENIKKTKPFIENQKRAQKLTMFNILLREVKNGKITKEEALFRASIQYSHSRYYDFKKSILNL